MSTRTASAPVGWCMGGGYALSFAVADSNLKAVVANYGPPPTDPDSLAKIHAAILGNYGGLDKGIPPAAVESFAADMKKLGKSIDVKIYPDAGHASKIRTTRPATMPRTRRMRSRGISTSSPASWVGYLEKSISAGNLPDTLMEEHIPFKLQLRINCGSRCKLFLLLSFCPC